MLKKFAWKPILTAIEERENGIEEALLQAEKAREEMKALKAENEQIMQQALEERDAMLKEAKAMKEREVEAAREIAEIEADKIIEAARRTIEGEKNLAIAEVKNQVASLSLEVAEKVLRDNLKSEDQQKNLVDKLINEIKLS